MSNPLFTALNGNNSMLQQFLQFKKTFQGDPKEQVQMLLNSGRMTQEQFNQLAAQATQIQKMFKL